MKDISIKNKRDIIICMFAGVVSLLLFVIIKHLWNWDLKVPFQTQGDAMGILTYVKIWTMDEKWGHITQNCAPFVTNRWHDLLDGIVALGPLYILAKVTRNVGYTINLYYMMTFALSAMCTYYVLRRCGVSESSSFGGSIIYSFIPGHLMRGITHIAVGSTFFLPLIVLLVIQICNGEMCNEKWRDKQNITMLQIFKSVDKKLLWGMAYLALVTFSTLYYGVFTMILLVFASIYICLQTKQMRHLLYFVFFMIDEAICLVMIYLPNIVAKIRDGEWQPYTIISRSIGDTETFALKIAQLILPITNHRVFFFSKIKEIYRLNFAWNENDMSSLGIVMSLGFIISCCAVLFPLVKNKAVILLGKINLFIVCIATVGGGAALIGMITYSIRCYNRFSYFIGCFSILVSMLLLDDIFKATKKLRIRGRWLVVGGIILIAILDQTSNGESYTKESAQIMIESYYNDERFVNQIEEYEDDAMVMVWPLNCPKIGTEKTKDGQYIVYEQGMPFLHAKSSKWNTGMGNGIGAVGDYWIENISYKSYEEQVKIMVAAGYSGVAILHKGYTPENLAEVKQWLEENVGPISVNNSNDTWSYYSFRTYKKKLREKYTQEEWNKIESVAKKGVEYYSFDNRTLHLTKENNNRDGMIVEPGTLQFGPYISLAKGEYHVLVSGKNLSLGQYSSTKECGVSMEIHNLEISENRVSYDVVLNEDINDIEFLCFNAGVDNIVIDNVKCYNIENQENENNEYFIRNYLGTGEN